MLKLILIVAAAILFALAAFRVSGPIEWQNAAFCCLVVALLIL